MNNACPTCGAVYAVTAKDVGRKLKCKKCATALTVTDAGLAVDGSAVAPAVPAAVVDDFDTGGGDEVVSTRGKKAKKFSGPKGPGLGERIAKLGGIPTILFGLGTFLVIWFTFMTPIGEASTLRAQMAESKVRMEQQAELKKLLPKGKKTPLELEGDERKTYEEKAKKIVEDYEKRIDEAKEEALNSQISNVRSMWYDKYGQLFGFVFLAFGCIGYLRTEQNLIVKIVAAVVLALMLLLMLNLGIGGCRDTPKPSVPKLGGKGGLEG